MNKLIILLVSTICYVNCTESPIEKICLDDAFAYNNTEVNAFYRFNYVMNHSPLSYFKMNESTNYDDVFDEKVAQELDELRISFNDNLTLIYSATYIYDPVHYKGDYTKANLFREMLKDLRKIKSNLRWKFLFNRKAKKIMEEMIEKVEDTIDFAVVIVKSKSDYLSPELYPKKVMIDLLKTLNVSKTEAEMIFELESSGTGRETFSDAYDKKAIHRFGEVKVERLDNDDLVCRISSAAFIPYTLKRYGEGNCLHAKYLPLFYQSKGEK